MSDLRESLTQSGTLYGFINTIVYAHDYADLTNKPQINGVTLIGNKTASDLGLVTPATEAVQSVNGETGAVVLDGNDIAYDGNNTINQQIDAVAASIPVIPVTSVNGETGDVVLDGSDIRYDSDYTVTAKIAAVEGEIPVVPVQSVNGETGNVVLDGDDIAYNSSLSVNQKIDAVEAAIPVVNYPVTSVNEKTGDVVIDDTDIEHSSGVTVNSIINTITQYTPVYGNTASGAIATFDTSLALPLQDLQIAINAVQEGTGVPSPQNDRNLVGFTGANVTRCGKNLFVFSDDTKASYQNCTYSYSTGGISITANANYARIGFSFYTPIGATLTISFKGSGDGNINRVEWNDAVTWNERKYGQQSLTATETAYTKTITTTSNVLFFGCYLTGSSASGSMTLKDIQIEVGSSPTAFEQFTSTTYPVSWQSEAGTVYGGYFRIVNGFVKLTVTHAIIDLGDLTWTYYMYGSISGGYSNTKASEIKLPSSGSVLTTSVSNKLTQTTDNNFTSSSDYTFAINTIGYIKVHWSGVNNSTELTNALIGTKLVYPLATPIEYTLTGIPPIYTLNGTNNIFGDTNGNTSVVYACSLKDYIDSQ